MRGNAWIYLSTCSSDKFGLVISSTTLYHYASYREIIIICAKFVNVLEPVQTISRGNLLVIYKS